MIGTIFILIEKMTELSYDVILGELQLMCPNSKSTVRDIFCSYDELEVTAIRKHFPKSHINGTLYAYQKVLEYSNKTIRGIN